MKTYKKCIDCLYYVANKGIKEHAECLKFGKKTVNVFEYAEQARKDPAKCGKDAKHYISKLIK